MSKPRTAVLMAVSLFTGLVIGYVDSRTTWDDAGVTAAAILIAGGAISVFEPRAWWLLGLGVSVPVVACNLVLHSNPGSVMAIGFGLLGAGIGATIGRALQVGRTGRTQT